MAVSFRVTGTWAELTADGSVAIPATPQAGDRMYLFARWKDFSITAQVTSPTGWTKLIEFADGTTNSGNGTGSVKVACWYRNWQSGDTDPTLDFSANPTNASAVIMVMAKVGGDVWLTPLARTAAMTNWTTTSQIVSASATVAVPSGGVVTGLIGIRDDTATMTRPTSGIDDSAAAIAWNGNYVESPATHHSTTTGDDGAADLGYRLVTTGATATLRLTGTLSAAETGAALWVVQGTATAAPVTVTPSTLALTTATFAPSARTNRILIPGQSALTLATFAPTVVATSDLFDGCVASWKLSDLTDATGRGNTLTNNNSVTFNTGKIGNAAYLSSASSQYLSLTSNADVQTGDIDFTVAFWFYQTAVIVDAPIISKDDNGSNREYIILTISNEVNFYVFRGGSGVNVFDGPAGGLTGGTWHSAICWHDATANTINIQIDDRTPVSQATGGALDVATSTQFEIGARSALSQFWSGRIDNVNIWKRVLTTGERAEFYNAGAGVEFTPPSGNVTVTPSTASLIVTRFAPRLASNITPAKLSLTLSTFAPTVRQGTPVIPATKSLSTSTFAPVIRQAIRVVPSTASLSVQSFAPTLVRPVKAIPGTVSLTTSAFAPKLALKVVPQTASLSLSSSPPQLATGVTPTTLSLLTATFAPSVSVSADVTAIPATADLLLSALEPAARVFMAFPRTSVLDDFNRANEDPAVGWTNVFASETGIKVLDNQATGPINSRSVYAGFVPADDQEAYVSVSTGSTSGGGSGERFFLLLRVTGEPSDDATGYFVTAVSTVVRLYRLDSLASFELLDTFSLVDPLTAGDQLGARAIDDVLEVAVNIQGGGWERVIIATDSTYPSGSIGLGVGSSADALLVDDFGGGSLPTDLAVTPDTATLLLTEFVVALVQGITPSTGILAITFFTPTITATGNKTVIISTASLSLATFAAKLALRVTPPTKALVTSTFAPAVVNPVAITPGTAVLSVQSFAPKLSATVTPGTLSLTTAKFAPSLNKGVVPATKNLTTVQSAPGLRSVITVPTQALALNGFAPTLTITDQSTVIPAQKSLTLASFAPTVLASISAIPSTIALTINTFAPRSSVNVKVVPSTTSLTISSHAPSLTTRINITPGTKSLGLSAFAPRSAVHIRVIPTTKSLALTSFAPSLRSAVIPPTANLALSSLAPVVLATINPAPLTASLTITAFAPSLSGAVVNVTPDTINLVLTTYAPNSVTFIPRGLINIGQENRTIAVSSENKRERISFENHVH